MENINSTNKGRDLLHANKLRIVLFKNRKDAAKDPETQQLLYIDQNILNKSKTRWKNLAMACIYYKKAYDMVPLSWIINCLKMYKISHEVINLIEKTMKTWRVELTAGGRILAEAKIQRGIFQGDALSPLLFIISMMQLNQILRKCTARYKLRRSQEKIDHLMYLNDTKLFANNEKEMETLIHAVKIYSQDIGMEFGIKRCHASYEMWQTTSNWRNGTIKSRQD